MNNKKGKRPKVKKYSLIVIPEGGARVWRRDISRKQIEAGFALVLTVCFILTGSIWGFTHYRQAYIATEDIRLENAKFEEERFELLSKLANLEQLVEKTERFASRLESSLGINPNQMAKGIGPVIESDFSEPAAVRQFNSLKFNGGEGKITFAGLDKTIDSVKDAVASVGERLQAVYELNQDRLIFSASIPSMWPTKGWVTSGFGGRRRPIRGGTSFHKGIDIAAPPGTPILCPGDGVVTYSGYRHGLGKTIIIDHGYGIVTIYGHNSQNYVKEGDRVRRGEIIGSVGRTGLATGSHLHYQVEVDGVPVDPMRYIHEHM